MATSASGYPSDLTDAQWELLAPLLPSPIPVGAPRKVDFRRLLDAIFYFLSNGIKWNAMPKEFPPEGTVRDYYHRWRRNGLWERIHDTLRDAVRLSVGKTTQPSAGSIDSQSVKATRTSGTRGFDAGKKNQRRQATSVG
jgi:putative transposase